MPRTFGPRAGVPRAAPVAARSGWLRAAGRSLERGQMNAARGQLGAFINAVEALARSERLDTAVASALMAAAEAILSGAGGPTSDSFTYTISDGLGGTATALVTVSLAP